MRRVGSVAGWAGGLALLAGGCTATQTADRAQTTPQRAVLAYRDPIARSELREEAIALLTEAASSTYAQERANAIEALLDAPSRLEPIAAVGLKDENEGVRAVAAMAVGRAKLTGLAGAVRPLVQDPSPFVAGAAIYALRELGQNVDISPLGAMLFDADSTRVRAQAAFILGELGDESALPMLADAARTETPGGGMAEQKLLQLQIAEAMIKLGERTQLDSVRAALLPARPEDLEATALAAQIIGNVNDKESIDRLIYLSASKGEQGPMPAEVILAVAGALSVMGVHDATFLADQHVHDANPVIRSQAAFVYGQIGLAENLEKLRALTGDESGLVRVSAADAILRVLNKVERRGRG